MPSTLFCIRLFVLGAQFNFNRAFLIPYASTSSLRCDDALIGQMRPFRWLKEQPHRIALSNFPASYRLFLGMRFFFFFFFFFACTKIHYCIKSSAVGYQQPCSNRPKSRVLTRISRVVIAQKKSFQYDRTGPTKIIPPCTLNW